MSTPELAPILSAPASIILSVVSRSLIPPDAFIFILPPLRCMIHNHTALDRGTPSFYTEITIIDIIHSSVTDGIKVDDHREAEEAA